MYPLLSPSSKKPMPNEVGSSMVPQRLNLKLETRAKSSDYHEKTLPNPETNQGKIKPHGERLVKQHKERKKKREKKVSW